MLKFVAVVRPQKAEALCQRLLADGFVEGLEAVEVLGSGRHPDAMGGMAIDVLPKARIAGWIEDADRDRLVEAICQTCRTGRIGDGKIFLLRPEAVAE